MFWLKMDIVRIPLPVNETSQQRQAHQTQWVTYIPKTAPCINILPYAVWMERGLHCNVRPHCYQPQTDLKMIRMDGIGLAKMWTCVIFGRFSLSMWFDCISTQYKKKKTQLTGMTCLTAEIQMSSPVQLDTVTCTSLLLPMLYFWIKGNIALFTLHLLFIYYLFQ